MYQVYIHMSIYNVSIGRTYVHIYISIYVHIDMSHLLYLLYVSFAKELYKRDCILQKRPVIWVHMNMSHLLHLLYVSFAKELYKRDYILQKRPIIWVHMNMSHLLHLFSNNMSEFGEGYHIWTLMQNSTQIPKPLILQNTKISKPSSSKVTKKSI